MAATDMENETSVLSLKLETRWNEIIAAEFILLLCVFLMAIIGNVIIFVAFCKSSRLQTIPNMYLMSFAVADILMALFVVPLSMGIVVKGKWIYSDSTCQFQGFVTTVLVAVTVLNITLCAVDRCFAVVRPAKYVEFMTQYVVTGLIASSWFFSLIVPSSYFLNGHQFSFHPGYLFCRPDMEEINYTFASVLDIVFVVLPLIIVVGCYVEVKRRIEIHSKKQNEAQEESRETWEKEEETARLFGATTISVLCLWVPFLLLEIVQSFEGFYIMPRSLYVVCSLLGLTAFACKVVVYSSVNKELKEEFLRAIKCRRSRRIVHIGQVENNGETFTSSRQSEKRNRPKTATQPEQFDTEEDEEELLFENRTPTPNDLEEGINWGTRSKSRIDSGNYSGGRTIPNTPFETPPDSALSNPKRTKSRKENVRFSESPTIAVSPPNAVSPPQTAETAVTSETKMRTIEDNNNTERTTDSPATLVSVGRLLTPAHPNERRVKRDNNLSQTGSRGRLTPIDNVRKTTPQNTAKEARPWR